MVKSMNKVTITFTNNTAEVLSVKNFDVAKKYAESVVTVFKHDGLIDTLSRIDSIDLDDGKVDILYQKENKNANTTNSSNDHCCNSGCNTHAHIAEGKQR